MSPRNGDVSFWMARAERSAPRAPLAGPAEADVAVVGAGFTGLWTAYYLKRAAPHLRVVVLEARFAGYGASGRNGGWVTASLAGNRRRYAATHGRDAVQRLQRAMQHSVDEVLAVAAAEGVEAHAVKPGVVEVARNAPQLERLRASVAEDRAWGLTDTVLLDADQTTARIGVEGAVGGSFSPHCARVDPGALVLGLARAVEALGVELHEGTRVTAITPHRVHTEHGDVTARHVVRATEGFTAALHGERRTWLPMNSSMVVTEPLGASAWSAIGWDGAELLGDAAHAYMYAQRTHDGRIAVGGRGKPYRFGSATDTDGSTPQATVEALTAILHDFFPSTRAARVEHAWSGVLGVPRDWCSTAGLDPATGIAWAGGYVGHGVATANLAGRTLRDLLLADLGEDVAPDLLALPWVGRRVRRWEPEPLRWVAVNTLYAAYRAADRAERRRRTTSPLGRVADLVSGRH